VGGLSILWNLATINMDQPLSTPDTISTHYHAVGSNKGGIITNTYGPQNHLGKDLFIRILSSLGDLIGKKHWIIG